MQRYHPRSALVIVDLQNDFADPTGSLAVHGGANLVPIINGEIAMARAAKAWGAELYPSVDAEAAADAPRVRKGSHGEDGYSGFTMRDPTTGETSPTELEGLLRNAGVEFVVVCGLATDYCVKATALDAVRLGFETAVLLDAIRPVDLAEGDGERAIEEMTAAGVHSWSSRMR